VAIQAVTGKTEAELLLHSIVATSARPMTLPEKFSGVAVEATGEPQTPLWTLTRMAGEGEVQSDDTIMFEAGGLRLGVVGGWAVALEGDHEECKFKIEIKDHPAPYRVGFKGLLNEGFENGEWFGRGPHESYLDRHASARVGRFQGSILDQTFKYVRPQENGNKFETRWMALLRSPAGTGAEGCAGLALAACHPTGSLHMQCHRYLLEDFDAGKNKVQQVPRHAGELAERAETAFYIDAAQMGLGGIDSWGRKPLPQHMISPSQDYNWTFQLRPLQAGYL
jgi:hypothetical protein